jgi:hypothetical protein
MTGVARRIRGGETDEALETREIMMEVIIACRSWGHAGDRSERSASEWGSARAHE